MRVRPTITTLSTVVVVLLLAGPLGAPAQQPGKLYRIGMLETIAASLSSPNLQAFNQERKALGYLEGQPEGSEGPWRPRMTSIGRFAGWPFALE
jgi:hypothetical protein